MAIQTVKVNRAPVLTLWAAVVAERIGYEWETALTLGKALAGLNAQSKGRSLGIYKAPEPGPGGKPKPKTGLGEDRWVELCGRPIPVKDTPAGLRAVVLDKPIDPESVTRYLEGKFGEALPEVRKAMQTLAQAYAPRVPGNLCAVGRVVDVHAQDAGNAPQVLLVQPEAGDAADAVEDQRGFAFVLAGGCDELALRNRVVVDLRWRQALRGRQATASRLWRLARLVIPLAPGGDDGARHCLAPGAAELALRRRSTGSARSCSRRCR